MATSIENYNSHQITIVKAIDSSTELLIDDRLIAYTLLSNDKYHSDFIPYQKFDSLLDLAKYIIDYMPNVVLE